MKAMTYNRFGPPEVLELREVPTPEPKPHDVLIRVHASSLSSYRLPIVGLLADAHLLNSHSLAQPDTRRTTDP